jgi:hypothetical protein
MFEQGDRFNDTVGQVNSGTALEGRFRDSMQPVLLHGSLEY